MKPAVRRVVFLAVWAAVLFLAPAFVEAAANPTRQTAVGLQNASSYFLSFSIDGVNRGGVPPGDKSIAFTVSPGQHTLRASTVIRGKPVTLTRVVTIGAGEVKTWQVTN